MLAPAPSTRLTNEEELYWLALRLVHGLGPVRTIPLLDAYQTPQAIFRASVSELEDHGLSGGVARSLISGCTFEDAAQQQQKMREQGAILLPFGYPGYPAVLANIADPPIVLFAKGRTELLPGVLVAMVGTRRPTLYGVNVTERLSADLAKAGAVIVSGMARGVDTCAHKAALSMSGGTVAVFGSGIDHIYPSENRRLAEDIATRGLILSEFPMGSPAHPQNFPLRNRIVSGISYAAVIVEGAQYSGSAITARTAMEQGREVYAVPGPITSRMSWVPNLLIKQGARLLQDAEDLLSDLPDHLRQTLLGQITNPDTPPKQEIDMDLRFGPSAPLAKALVQAVNVNVGVKLDSLFESLEGYSPSEIVATLFELELAGMVRQLPGKQFARVW
ncbi:MAG TPA: DNA-processing protein DprA [Bryobacteraceae bacterium]|nr:DNA-processing protein DprA [Bryobacteraceae bacterium]